MKWQDTNWVYRNSVGSLITHAKWENIFHPHLFSSDGVCAAWHVLSNCLLFFLNFPHFSSLECLPWNYHRNHPLGRSAINIWNPIEICSIILIFLIINNRFERHHYIYKTWKMLCVYFWIPRIAIHLSNFSSSLTVSEQQLICWEDPIVHEMAPRCCDVN